MWWGVGSNDSNNSSRDTGDGSDDSDISRGGMNSGGGSNAGGIDGDHRGDSGPFFIKFCDLQSALNWIASFNSVSNIWLKMLLSFPDQPSEPEGK